MINPVKTAKNRLEVRDARIDLILSPATSISASLMTFMPYRNNPKEPRSVKTSLIPYVINECSLEVNQMG